jgi:hypothetical protein
MTLDSIPARVLGSVALANPAAGLRQWRAVIFGEGL